MSINSEKGNNEHNSKRISTAILALISFTAYMPVSSLPAFATTIGGSAGNMNLPSIDTNNIINGEVIQTGDSRLDVNVVGTTGTVGQFDWNSFNVANGNTVNFGFSANSQTALNRVLNGGGMSYIYGALTSGSTNGCSACANTSKVILINPAGMLFGNGSSVNLNSFTASTYDVKGAKNIADLSGTALDNYKGTGGKTGSIWNIAGSATTANGVNGVEFVANDNMVDGNGFLADSTGIALAKIEAKDGASITGDKNLAFVGNRIELSNGATLASHFDSTPNVNSSPKVTVGNVKLITGDGVTFQYASSGNTLNAYSVTNATHTKDQAYGISIADSTVKGGALSVYAGGQKSGTYNNTIDIQNSTLRAKKTYGAGSTTTEQYLNGTTGNLEITGRNQSININKSDIQTINDKYNGDANYTKDADMGDMVISATKDVTITDSQVRTADSTQNASSITSGNLIIKSSAGNVNLNKVTSTVVNSADSSYTENGIVSAGDMTIEATTGNVNINGYDSLKAVGNSAISSNTGNRTLTITAGNNINATNAKTINATTVDMYAGNALTTTGSTVIANTLNAKSKETKFDSSFLAYNDLNLYDDTRTSNVTFSNGTKLRDKDSGANLVIKTNGNITVDNAHLLNYNGSTASTQNSIKLNSTNGNITVKNGSNLVGANGNVELNATNGAVTVSGAQAQSVVGNVVANAKNNITINGNSNLASANGQVNLTSTAGSINIDGASTRVQTASTGGAVNVKANQNVALTNGARISANKGDANVTATNGKISATGSSQIQGVGGNVNLTQKGDMNVDTDFANGIVATSGKLTIKTDGSIISSQLKSGDGTLGSYTGLVSLNNDNANAKFIFAGDKRMEMNAGNNITSTGFVSTNAVDLVAGNNISLTNTNSGSNQHILLEDTSTKAGGTTLVSSANGDTMTHNLTIKGGTKTTLEGKTVTSDAGTVIDTQGNKLAVNAPGKVDITVKNMDKTKPANGLDINADVNTSVTQDALTGRKVKVTAQDGNLVVSKIKSDTLDLVANNIYAGTTTISTSTDRVSDLTTADTTGKGYIEVKTAGGFNIDTSLTYAGTGSGITYDKNAASTITSSNVGSMVAGSEYVKAVAGTEGTQVEQRPQADCVYAENLKGTTYETDYTTGVRVEDRVISTGNTQETDAVTGPTITYNANPSDPDYDATQVGKTGHWITSENQHEIETTEMYQYKQSQTDTYYNQQRTNTTASSEIWAKYNSSNDITDSQHVATLNSSQQQGFVVVYDKSRTEANGTVDQKVGDNGTIITAYGDWTKTGTTFDIYTSSQNSGVTVTLAKEETATRSWVTDSTNRTWCADDEKPATDRARITDDIAATVRNPRHAEPTSDSSPVAANIANPTDTIVAAAARLDYGEDEENSDDSNEIEDSEI